MKETVSITDLLAPVLGFSSDALRTDSIETSSNGVSTFCLKAVKNLSQFIVHYVAVPDDLVACASLFNAKYASEVINFKNATVAVAKFYAFAHVDDNGIRFPIFLEETVPSNEILHHKHTLEYEDLLQVAEQLAQIHACCYEESNGSAEAALAENFSSILKAKKKNIMDNASKLIDEIIENYGCYLKDPTQIKQRVDSLLDSLSNLDMLEYLTGESRIKVLCHGFLTADDLQFDANGKLIEIRNWDNAHYGNSAEDLTYLIITSAPNDVICNRYMSIFRTYYYRLIDIRYSTLKLGDLRTSFKEIYAHAVIMSIPRLIAHLHSVTDEELQKETLSRWECTLGVAEKIQLNGYESDTEHPLFSK